MSSDVDLLSGPTDDVVLDHLVNVVLYEPEKEGPIWKALIHEGIQSWQGFINLCCIDKRGDNLDNNTWNNLGKG